MQLFDPFIFKKSLKVLIINLLLISSVMPLFSQYRDYEAVKKMIQDFKRDERGPYQAIRWFCPDGSILPPKERCPEPGGLQHALAKDIVQKLATESKIYLGQILAGSDFDQFFDEINLNLRLQQYQMENFLQANDDGWIMRRARFYRGAVQAEDEENWGREFLQWLVAKDNVINEQFFILRQTIKDLPHRANNDKWMSIRGLSKTISDSIPSFMDLRVKLHGQPEFQDIQRVKAYYTKNQNSISENIQSKLLILIDDLQFVYQSNDIPALQSYLKMLETTSPLYRQLAELVTSNKIYEGASSISHEEKFRILWILADLIYLIREDFLHIESPSQRLLYLDLSNDLEKIIFQRIGDWRPQSIGELLEKNYILTKSLAGCGFLEIWEWRYIEPIIQPIQSGKQIEFEKFSEMVSYTRRVVEWGTSMVRTVYDPVINLFSQFEPLAIGFLDDRIRSSLLLAQGDLAGQLAEIVSAKMGITHRVIGIGNQGLIRGINPGYAFGELVVITDVPEKVIFSDKKIYLLQRAPVDMKPVAGIATVSEGNLVSHVQLLARNLGIPNAVISEQNLLDLLPYAGKNVLYAVSPDGTVLLKLESHMTAEEKSLIEKQKRSEDRIQIPATRLNLSNIELLNLKNLRSSDSGILCGPKAANLGQLKSLFPDNVVNGLVIPFSIFKNHLAQQMSGSGISYWSFLQNIFKEASDLKASGKSDEEIEPWILGQFNTLREAIRTISFLPGFRGKIADQFLQIFGKELGEIPVFIRSDTNMEDLKDFTGAGLNLTVFNVRDAERIFQSIRDVWASPYAERSYRWRQKYLLNPENVFPSILIIPTVRVEKSGVLITTGITSADSEDLTIAFNRGAGGAVEGQLAESYLLKKNGSARLISPSRERSYTDLPENGGTVREFSNFNERILSTENIKQIRIFSKQLQSKLKGKSGINSIGPFDVEFGFLDNKIWLFQVRSFVESKQARSSHYLKSLDTGIKNQSKILLEEKY